MISIMTTQQAPIMDEEDAHKRDATDENQALRRENQRLTAALAYMCDCAAASGDIVERKSASKNDRTRYMSICATAVHLLCGGQPGWRPTSIDNTVKRVIERCEGVVLRAHELGLSADKFPGGGAAREIIKRNVKMR